MKSPVQHRCHHIICRGCHLRNKSCPLCKHKGDASCVPFEYKMRDKKLWLMSEIGKHQVHDEAGTSRALKHEESVVIDKTRLLMMNKSSSSEDSWDSWNRSIGPSTQPGSKNQARFDLPPCKRCGRYFTTYVKRVVDVCGCIVCTDCEPKACRLPGHRLGDKTSRKVMMMKGLDCGTQCKQCMRQLNNDNKVDESKCKCEDCQECKAIRCLSHKSEERKFEPGKLMSTAWSCYGCNMANVQDMIRKKCPRRNLLCNQCFENNGCQCECKVRKTMSREDVVQMITTIEQQETVYYSEVIGNGQREAVKPNETGTGQGISNNAVGERSVMEVNVTCEDCRRAVNSLKEYVTVGGKLLNVCNHCYELNMSIKIALQERAKNRIQECTVCKQIGQVTLREGTNQAICFRCETNEKRKSCPVRIESLKGAPLFKRPVEPTSRIRTGAERLSQVEPVKTLPLLFHS